MTLKKTRHFRCFRKPDFLKHYQCFGIELSAGLKDQHGGKQLIDANKQRLPSICRGHPASNVLKKIYGRSPGSRVIACCRPSQVSYIDDSVANG